MTAHPIHLYRVCCDAAAVRRDQRSIIRVDRFPLAAGRPLRVCCIRTVVVCEHLKFSVNSADAARPFPYIATQIRNAAGTSVMVPCERSCSGCHATNLPTSTSVVERRNGFVELFRAV